MKYRKVSRGRRMSTWKGKSNSKFKTRHRKMRGGDSVGGVDGNIQSFQSFECSNPDSHVGGPNYNDPEYNMHASEETKIPPNTPLIKEYNDTTVNTVFTSNTMKMGLFFNKRSFFTSGPKHLHTLGLIQVITDNARCNSFAECLPFFYNDSTGVIHSNTKYVFFGQLDHKGTKNGWGICYDRTTLDSGRIFIGSWNNGKMNGLGIEVDFKYNATDNKHEPIGIYYGHFYQGKRNGFGIYHTVASGTETLFQTQIDGNMCMLLDKSFEDLPDKEKTLHKNKFTTMCISSLSLNSIPQDVGEYTEFQFKNIGHGIETTSLLVKKGHGDKEYHIFREYVSKYKKFVSFCKTVLDDALTKYDAQKHSEKNEAERKKLEKEEKIKTARMLKDEGLFIGDIVDPEEKAAENERITSCTTSLKNLGYVIQTPEQKRAKEEEEKGKKLAEHEKLTEAKKELEAMQDELRILSQSRQFLKTINPNSGQNYYHSVGRSNSGRRSFRNRSSSSRSSRSSDNSGSHNEFPLLLQSYTTPRKPQSTRGTPALSPVLSPETPTKSVKEISGTQVTPAGTSKSGGNLMRKKTRTNKRKKTRKFRKSRRGGRR